MIRKWRGGKIEEKHGEWAKGFGLTGLGFQGLKCNGLVFKNVGLSSLKSKEWTGAGLANKKRYPFELQKGMRVYVLS